MIETDESLAQFRRVSAKLVKQDRWDMALRASRAYTQRRRKLGHVRWNAPTREWVAV